jgi:hypothetical protein
MLSTPRFGAVRVGDEVPPFRVPLTMQRLVMQAAATRAFVPVHHDSRIAQASGAPDAFVDSMFLETLYEATTRGWAGLGGTIESLRFTMRALSCVGDVLVGRGRVAAKSDADGRQLVTLDVWTDSERGVTTSGQVVVRLPA